MMTGRALRMVCSPEEPARHFPQQSISMHNTQPKFISGMPTRGGQCASLRRRRALAVTDAGLKVIAALASLGLTSSPNAW
jgi:hypothetical protein